MAKPKRGKSGIFTLMVNFDYQRRNLTLGRIDRTAANRFAANLEHLIQYRRMKGGVPPELESWVNSLSPRHIEQLGELRIIGRTDLKLTVHGLIEQFVEQYELRTDIAASTKSQFRLAMKRFPVRLKSQIVAHLEPKKEHHRPNAQPVFTNETLDLYRYVESWQREHYAKSSWSRANGRLKEVGVWAVRRGLCDFNPFSPLPSPGELNEDRNVYVEREWVLDAMDMAIDPDTRLLFALGRFAGLRIPSEARTLKPSHVHWDAGRLEVFDSKKRRIRTMPLFDQIRQELELHRESTGGWDRFILSARIRENTDANNYGLMVDAISRTQWPRWTRLRQNLRASCENDLLRMGFAERQVTEWIGHTVDVSRRHYQKQTDVDYRLAIEKATF